MNWQLEDLCLSLSLHLFFDILCFKHIRLFFKKNLIQFAFSWDFFQIKIWSYKGPEQSLNWLAILLQVLRSHEGIASHPPYSTSQATPCLWPGKATKDGSSGWAPVRPRDTAGSQELGCSLKLLQEVANSGCSLSPFPFASIIQSINMKRLAKDLDHRIPKSPNLNNKEVRY